MTRGKLKIIAFVLSLLLFLPPLAHLRAETEVRAGDPRVTFRSMSFPPAASSGDLIKGSLFLQLSAPLETGEKVFFHLVKPGQKQVAVNADFYPRLPTPRWEVGEVMEAGPLNLFIPFDLEAGVYDVQAGLMNIVREETRVRFVREAYTNKEIANFTVGTIAIKTVEAKNVPSQAPEVDLVTFDTDEALLFWEARGAEIKLMKEGTEAMALVTIKANSGFPYPAVALENFFQLKPTMSDWTLYDSLEVDLRIPAGERAYRIFLQIRDKSGRIFKQEIRPVPGQTLENVVSTVNLGGAIDIANIDELKFFTMPGDKDVTFYLSRLRLISRGALTGKPAVTFVRLEAPEKVKRGQVFKVRPFFKLNQPIFSVHKMFVHVYRQYDLKGRIGVDSYLVPPIRNWPLNKEIGVESAPLMISPDAPPGTYMVRAGLYVIADSMGEGYVKMADWEEGGKRTDFEMQPVAPIDYIKQPYTNPEIRDWEIGKITVE